MTYLIELIDILTVVCEKKEYVKSRHITFYTQLVFFFSPRLTTYLTFNYFLASFGDMCVSVFNCTLLIYQKKRIVAERNRDHLILKHRREDASRQSIFVVNYL